jgi:hypothetical protein
MLITMKLMQIYELNINHIVKLEIKYMFLKYICTFEQ